MAAITTSIASVTDQTFSSDLNFLRLTSVIQAGIENRVTLAQFTQRVAENLSGERQITGMGILKNNDLRLSILLVEDNPLTQQLHVAILNAWNHTVEVANDGEDALKLHRNGKFDLVMIDLQMPVMGGVETTKKIREREAGTSFRTTVIALTGNSPDGSREKCLAAGMDDYFVKPFTVENFHAFLIRHAITIRHAAEKKRIKESAPQFNYAAALQKSDPVVIAAIAQPFLDDLPEQLLTMRRSWEKQDWAIFQREASALSSVLSTFHAEPAQHIAAEIDRSLRSCRIEKVLPLFQKLEDEIDLFCGQLRSFQLTGA